MARARTTTVIALVALIAACEREELTLEAEFASYPYRGLPVWELAPGSTGEPLLPPEPLQLDERPTLLLFTASWCPPCVASLMLDLAIARTYGDRIRMGIALEETPADFASSAMGRLFAGVPVWTSESVRPLASRCGVRTIPYACLVHRGRVVFRGAPVNLRNAIDAFLRDRLEPQLAADSTQRAIATARIAAGVTPGDVDGIVEATRGDPHWQHAVAFAIAAREQPSATDLVLAVGLAREVVVTGGGLDFGHLDTYSLALSKAGRAEDASNVGWRVLSLCRKTGSKCMMERLRANGLIYYWRLISERR